MQLSLVPLQLRDLDSVLPSSVHLLQRTSHLLAFSDNRQLLPSRLTCLEVLFLEVLLRLFKEHQ